MLPNTTIPDPPRPSRRRGLAGPVRLAALGLAISLFASGCFVLQDGRNHGIGTETTRANVVVYQEATDALYQIGRAKGSSTSRKVLLDAAPATFQVSTAQRAAICAISVALCLSAPQIGSTIISWFRRDIRERSDFWEALREAGRRDRCFAWTFVPSRNLTHKGAGTAGCRAGVVM